MLDMQCADVHVLLVLLTEECQLMTRRHEAMAVTKQLIVTPRMNSAAPRRSTCCMHQMISAWTVARGAVDSTQIYDG